MKLLYINKIHTNYGWGLETFLNQALQNLDFRTICIDYHKNKYKLANELLQIQEDFDALLIQRGCGYLIPLPLLKAIQRPRFLVFTELVARNPQQHYLLKSGLFEHVFLRSIPCINWVKEQGWLQDSQVSLFLSAVNPDFHRFIPNIEKTIDVLFVGTLLPRRQALINELAKHFSVKGCTTFGEEMVYLLNRAKIILNLHGTDFPDTETRVYETLACKGFLITERLSEENPFRHGVHLIEVSTLAEMKEQIDYYLAHDRKRLSIAESGYQEVVQHHTFSVRAKQLYDVLSDNIHNGFSYSPLKRDILQTCIKYEKLNSIKNSSIIFTRKYLSRVKQYLLSHL